MSVRAPDHFQATDLFVSRALWLKIRKPIISLFLLFHFYVFLLCVGRYNELARTMREPFVNYILFTGLAQNYGVFAPSPRRTNIHFLAVVTYEHGERKLVALPRMERLSLTQKFFKERYRKFLNDNVAAEKYAFLYRDVAARVAHDNDLFKDNHPVRVALVRMQSDIPPLEDKRANPPDFDMKVLFTLELEREVEP